MESKLLEIKKKKLEERKRIIENLITRVDSLEKRIETIESTLKGIEMIVDETRRTVDGLKEGQLTKQILEIADKIDKKIIEWEQKVKLLKKSSEYVTKDDFLKEINELKFELLKIKYSVTPRSNSNKS